MQERELTGLFRKLGARDPAAWAHSQIREGIPQLARFLFLRQAWRLVVSEDDRQWLAESMLYRVGEDDRPIAMLGGLHESVLETDPSGREMRPSTPD